MTCADCDGTAKWVFDDKGALPVSYCDAHLPGFLRSRASSGSLTKAPDAAPPAAPEPEPFTPPPPFEPEKARRKKKDADQADPD